MLAVVTGPESKAQERQQRFDSFVQRAGFVVPSPSGIEGKAGATDTTADTPSKIAADNSEALSHSVQIDPNVGSRHEVAVAVEKNTNQNQALEDLPSSDKPRSSEKRPERSRKLRAMRSKSFEGRPTSGGEDILVRTSTNASTKPGEGEVRVAVDRAEERESRDIVLPTRTAKWNHISQRETRGSCSSTSGFRSWSPDRESQASPTSAAVSASGARRGGGGGGGGASSGDGGGDEESIAGAKAERASLSLRKSKADRRRMYGMRKSMSMLESGDREDGVNESARQQKFAANVGDGTAIESISQLARKYPELSATLTTIQLRNDLRYFLDDRKSCNKRTSTKSPRTKHRRTRSEHRKSRQRKESSCNETSGGRLKGSSDGLASSIAQSDAHLATFCATSFSASTTAAASKFVTSRAAPNQLIGCTNSAAVCTNNQYSSCQCTPPNRPAASQSSGASDWLLGKLHETQSSRDLLRQSVTLRHTRRPALSGSSRQQSMDVQGARQRVELQPNACIPPIPPHSTRR